jgi:hypothetical protein
VILDLFLQIINLNLFVVDLLHKKVFIFLVFFDLAAELRADGLHFLTATTMFLSVELQLSFLLCQL